MIGDRRIVKPVAQYNFTCLERRTNDFPHELGAAGVHEQELRLGSHGAVLFAVLEGVADFLADRSAAGFAQEADAPARVAQPLGEKADLGRLASALGAFQCDEDPFHQLRGQCCGSLTGESPRLTPGAAPLVLAALV